MDGKGKGDEAGWHAVRVAAGFAEGHELPSIHIGSWLVELSALMFVILMAK